MFFKEARCSFRSFRVVILKTWIRPEANFRFLPNLMLCPLLKDRVLSIFSFRPVGPTETNCCKMGRHFEIKPGQPDRTVFFILHFLPHSVRFREFTELKWGNLPVWENGTVNFGQSGPPPEVVPNIPVGTNRNGPCHLNSYRNDRDFRVKGKHP